MLGKPESESSLHPSIQVFILLIFIVLGLFIGGAVGFGIITATYPVTMLQLQQGITVLEKYPNALWILQISSTTVPLLIVPLLFARFIVKQPVAYLKLNFRFSPLLLLIVFGVSFFSLPIMEVLINVNERLVLPGFLKGLEEWMKQSEEQTRHLMENMLKLDTLGKMFFALFIVGFVTACAEEFVFRGCLQSIFTRWTKNTHAAIWITAILFSAFHLQFYGFLPRLMLGIFFGYFTLWSGSIWPAIWAHFINNGLVVVMTYLYQNKVVKISPDEQHVFNYSAYVFSLLITVLLLLAYRQKALTRYTDYEAH